LETCWQGTANAWECDEMGHLNVRHYLARAEDALAILLASHAIPPRAVTTQHIRYHRETRAGTPLRIDGGFTRAGTTPQAYFEFISPYDGVLRATLIADLADGPPVAPPCLALPARGAPRGLTPAAPAGGASRAPPAGAGRVVM
jgi:acyl-CoA thioester hydrolase